MVGQLVREVAAQKLTEVEAAAEMCVFFKARFPYVALRRRARGPRLGLLLRLALENCEAIGDRGASLLGGRAFGSASGSPLLLPEPFFLLPLRRLSRWLGEQMGVSARMQKMGVLIDSVA